MIKPGSLREHLTAALPEFLRDPDRMLVFIDRGKIIATGVGGLSFEYQYTLNMILTDYSGHADAVMVPLLEWLVINQPELLDNPAMRDQIVFEVDLLGNDKIDLDLKLPLTERVGVHEKPGGGWDIEHYPEPPRPW